MRKIHVPVVAAALLLTLGGCSLLAPTAPTPAPTTTPNVDPTPEVDPVDDSWLQLTHCDGAPDEPWVMVAGYPAAEVDASEVTAECGDLWIEDDGENFLGFVDEVVSESDLDSLGAELESAGYEKLFDEFTPEAPDETGYVGARDYYLDGDSDGDFTRVALEIYANSTADSFTVYVDYLSPETRALG